MDRLPFSENPNGSYYYHGSTLYFVNTAGQVIQLESYDTRADARQMCQHRNNYLNGVGCGATELSKDKISKQYLPERFNRGAYLKLFAEFAPFPVCRGNKELAEKEYCVIQDRIDEILDREGCSPEELAYISVLASLIHLYENPIP